VLVYVKECGSFETEKVYFMTKLNLRRFTILKF